MTDVITDPRFWALHAAATQLWDALAEYRRAWETGLAMHQGEYDMRRMWQSRAEEYENDTIGLRDEVKALRSALSASEARCERMTGALEQAAKRADDTGSPRLAMQCRAALSADAAEQSKEQAVPGELDRQAAEAIERARVDRCKAITGREPSPKPKEQTVEKPLSELRAPDVLNDLGIEPMTPIATAGDPLRPAKKLQDIADSLALDNAAMRKRLEKLELERDSALELLKLGVGSSQLALDGVVAERDEALSRLASQQAELDGWREQARLMARSKERETEASLRMMRDRDEWWENSRGLWNALAESHARAEKAEASLENVDGARLRIETVAVKERLEKQRLAHELRDVRVELAESRAAMQELDTEATKALEELGRVRDKLERHQTEPDPNDPDGWIRRSALNNWCDRALKAETRSAELEMASVILLDTLSKHAAGSFGEAEDRLRDLVTRRKDPDR